MYKSDIKYKREDKMSLGWVVYSLTIVNVKTYTLGQWVLCTECVARWLVVSCNSVTLCNTPLLDTTNMTSAALYL